jgi:hypothetical protein
MGKLTQAQIASQGMTLAGKNTTALASLVLVSFNAWLRSTYAGWLWPFLNKQSSGVALAAGTTALNVGTTGTISDDIADIFDPLYIYSSTYADMGKARIRQIRGGSALNEPAIQDPTKNRGMPREFKARPSPTTDGLWTLTPWPVPDKAYLLVLDYKFQPTDIVPSEIPIYPNDRTLIQAAKVMALEHMNGTDGNHPAELELLAGMVAQDYVKYGSEAGINDSVGLDPSVHK